MGCLLFPTLDSKSDLISPQIRYRKEMYAQLDEKCGLLAFDLDRKHASGTFRLAWRNMMPF